MNKLVSLTLVIFVLITSCANSNETILGSWERITKDSKSYFELNNDNTFSGTTVREDIDWKYSGTWVLDGKTLIWTYTYSSWDAVESGLVDKDTIIKLSADYIELQSESGSVYVYQRVQ